METFDNKADYLEAVRSQIRCRKARNLIAEEIDQHIEDQKASYLDEGDEEKAALIKALEQMGDPIETGRQLDKIHRPRMEWSILLTVLALCCLGVLAQLNLRNDISSLKLSNSVDFERHLIFLGIGILLMTVVYFIDYTAIGRLSKLLCLLFLAAFYLYAPFGTIVNGSIRYLYAYGLLFIPIYGGILYAYRRKGYSGFIICLFISMISCVIEMQFIVQSSIYLGVLLSGLIMLSAAVMKDWFGTSRKLSLAVIWGWIPLCICFLTLSGIRIFREYQLERMKNSIYSLLHTGNYESDYQINIVRSIISQAKLIGGSHDVTKNYLPGFNSEYILTYVLAKWGIAAGIFVVGLFIMIIGRMIFLSCHQKNSLGMFVGLGCSLVFALQGSIYILSNFGIPLVAQVNLPFVSFGNSSLLINFIILGLMLSVFRNTRIIKEIPYQRKFAIRIERIK